MVTITIDEETLIEMLINRLKSWTDDEDTIELFETYYNNMVYDGCFEGSTVDIMSIVDNDYINNTYITTKKEYEKSRNKILKDEIQAYIEENANIYSEEEKEDYVANLKDKIEELKEDYPAFEELECGNICPDNLDGYAIEAISSSAILTSC